MIYHSGSELWLSPKFFPKSSFAYELSVEDYEREVPTMCQEWMMSATAHNHPRANRVNGCFDARPLHPHLNLLVLHLDDEIVILYSLQGTPRWSKSKALL
jgi:hypothetical protein